MTKKHPFAFLAIALSLSAGLPALASAEKNFPKENDPAPLFSAMDQDGKSFDLKSRQGQWTVLYFYPKSGTPGCTRQACAFRDNISRIRAQGAEVLGISADTVVEQAAFHKQHHLNFSLLADPDAHVIDLYGTRMAERKLSKRWTFVIDPELRIRAVDKDVDPVVDSEKMATQLAELKKQKK